MAFLRVVEVFPPLRKPGSRGTPDIDDWLESASKVKAYSDLVLVASLKDLGPLKFSTVEAAIQLKQRAGVDAAPVLMVRGQSRTRLLSDVFTCLSLGVTSIMLAWGDNDRASAKASSAGFRTLSEALAEVSSVASGSGVKARLFAPVDLSNLGHPRGSAMAKSRLESGASLLLAQPPTTDSRETLDAHSGLLNSAGLSYRVLLNVFPFRDRRDVESCESRFGWKLPASLHEAASSGPAFLESECKAVVQEIRRGGFPGVYLSTRGDTLLAERLLS